MLNAGAETRDDRMKYRRPSRFRRVAKWVGLAVCVFLTTAWAVSTVFQFGVTRTILPRVLSPANWDKTLPPIYWVRLYTLYRGKVTINGLAVAKDEDWGVNGPFAATLSLSDFGFVLPNSRRFSGIPGVSARLTVIIPLWLPLIVFGIPTACCWFYDRRPAKGHCQTCGYNLTGNESGKCPECATAVPKQEKIA